MQCEILPKCGSSQWWIQVLHLLGSSLTDSTWWQHNIHKETYITNRIYTWIGSERTTMCAVKNRYKGKFLQPMEISNKYAQTNSMQDCWCIGLCNILGCSILALNIPSLWGMEHTIITTAPLLGSIGIWIPAPSKTNACMAWHVYPESKKQGLLYDMLAMETITLVSLTMMSMGHYIYWRWISLSHLLVFFIAILDCHVTELPSDVRI